MEQVRNERLEAVVDLHPYPALLCGMLSSFRAAHWMPVDRMLLFGVAVFILALLLQQAQSNRSLPAVLLRQRPALQQWKRRLEAAVERPATAVVDEAVIGIDDGNIYCGWKVIQYDGQ